MVVFFLYAERSMVRVYRSQTCGQIQSSMRRGIRYGLSQAKCRPYEYIFAGEHIQLNRAAMNIVTPRFPRRWQVRQQRFFSKTSVPSASLSNQNQVVCSRIRAHVLSPIPVCGHRL